MQIKYSHIAVGGLLLAGLCTGQAATRTDAPAANPVHAVLHIDINPSKAAQALPILRKFVTSASREPGVTSIELLKQEGGENHFTVIEVIRSRADYDNFIEAPSVRAMRAAIQPMLGSPFDERLHTQVVTSTTNEDR
jgi:quinol monooxygenase YgiN